MSEAAPTVEPVTADPDQAGACSVSLKRLDPQTRAVRGSRDCPEAAAVSALMVFECGQLVSRRFCLGHLADAIRGDLCCRSHVEDADDRGTLVELDPGSGS